MDTLIVFHTQQGSVARSVPRKNSYRAACSKFINNAVNMRLKAAVQIVTDDRIEVFSTDGVGSVIYKKQPKQTRAKQDEMLELMSVYSLV